MSRETEQFVWRSGQHTHILSPPCIRRISMRRHSLSLITAACAIVACGDPESSDHRGYTKAPLENPGVMIGGEDRTTMAEMNEPLLPSAEELEVEEEGAAPQGGQAGGQAKAAPLPP